MLQTTSDTDPLKNGMDYFPKISIITVTYNAAQDLEKTVLSVAGQIYSNIEYIIIDGGSSDNTHEVIQQNSQVIDYQVSEPDHGIYDAMNKGLAAATGDYVQFLNAGDYFFHDNSLNEIIRAAGKEYDLLYGDIQLVSIDRTSRHQKAKEFTLDSLKRYGTGVLCHQAMLVRRAIAPLYDARYTYKGELNWYFDICINKPDLLIYHLQKPFVFYFLGGLGYSNFLRNRIEWYVVLYNRFGIRSVINRQFLRVIYHDFQYRFPLLRKIICRS